MGTVERDNIMTVFVRSQPTRHGVARELEYQRLQVCLHMLTFLNSRQARDEKFQLQQILQTNHTIESHILLQAKLSWYNMLVYI